VVCGLDIFLVPHDPGERQVAVRNPWPTYECFFLSGAVTVCSSAGVEACV
jgi:hypothetical protein